MAVQTLVCLFPQNPSVTLQKIIASEFCERQAPESGYSTEGKEAAGARGGGASDRHGMGMGGGLLSGVLILDSVEGQEQWAETPSKACAHSAAAAAATTKAESLALPGQRRRHPYAIEPNGSFMQSKDTAKLKLCCCTL